MTTSTIEFTKTSIPARARSGRTPLPNPFMEAFPADKEALEFPIPEGRDSVECRRALRQIRQAAKHHDRTGRTTFTDNEDGSVTVTTWTVPRVTRDGSPAQPVKPAAKKTAAKKAPAKRTTRKAA
jgi:hypothetical protein